MEPAAGGGAGRAEGHGLRAQTDDDAGGEVPQEDEGLAQLLAHAHLRLGVNRVRPRFAVVGCAGSGTWNSTVSLANLEAASPGRFVSIHAISCLSMALKYDSRSLRL